MKMEPDRIQWLIYGDAIFKIIPFLHKQRLNDGFTPLVSYEIPHWVLRVGGHNLHQCVTDLRVLCLARTAWHINAEALDRAVYDIDDATLRKTALDGMDLLGNKWPKPRLQDLPLEEMFQRIKKGEEVFELSIL